MTFSESRAPRSDAALGTGREFSSAADDPIANNGAMELKM